MLLLFLASISVQANEDWRGLARRLSGEAKHVRVEMVEALRKTPNLDDHLRAAFLGPDRFLAFDVLSALEKRDFLGEVIQLIPEDPSGFAVHAANSLARPDDRMKLIETYRKHLADPRPSAPARMALFDTLGRLGALLSDKDCAAGLEHESPEVRASALGYIRHSNLRLGRKD